MKRPEHQMPDFIEHALASEGLRGQYDARPWYQRNDYVGWINQAKRAETQAKRLRQMLDELQAGDVYMKMAWRSKQRRGR